MTDKQKDYFSSREAAKLLGVAVSTVQLWANSGHLKAWSTSGGHRRIARTSVEDILNKQAEALGSQQTQQADKTLTVVIVEDDISQQRLYQKYLLAWGLNASVIIANDGYEGLVKIGHTTPDIVITDLMMPNMDGFQMVKALDGLPELDKTQVIVVSGLSDDEINGRGGLPKGVHLLTKPILAGDLETLVRQAVHT